MNDLLSTTAWQWQLRLEDHSTTSVELVDKCLDQIKRHNSQGQHLNALLSVVSRDVALAQATKLDAERQQGKVRGAMHGIPVIVKDIFPTSSDLGLTTTCGAEALRFAYGKKNCPLVQKLLDAGMILIGKSNLNEYCRLRDVKSGWSALGGQTQSPYIYDGLAAKETPVGNSTISGSSSGSAASVAAGFAPVAIGTETTGSIVIPANRGGLYSLKVTNCRAPKDEVLCLSREHDSIGAMAKSAVDLKNMTDIILDQVHTAKASEKDLRVGFVEPHAWRFKDELCPLSAETGEFLAREYEQVAEKLNMHGMQAIRDVQLSNDPIKYRGEDVIGATVDAEFQDNFADFMAGLENTDIRSLANLIEFNDSHAEAALPSRKATWWKLRRNKLKIDEANEDQKDLKRVAMLSVPQHQVKDAIEYGAKVAGSQRLDVAMHDHSLDLIIGPGDSTLFQLAALAGYPIGSVPLLSVKYSETNSRPEGLLVVGKADAEDVILDFMLRYEKIFPKRTLPQPLMEAART